MSFPQTRLRRLRVTPAVRALVRETDVHSARLLQPLFVRHGRRLRRPIASMPGQFQLSVDELLKEATALREVGVPGVLLFGIPDRKDDRASGAYDPKGIVPTAVRALKRELPDLLVICDVCLCEYTSHGHCGVVRRGNIANDPTLKLLARAAVVYADAGADFVAPSDMMDGRVGAIRAALDRAGFHQTGILSYAAKFASAFYGPFREAAENAPRFGDRRAYQMDAANRREALREVALDVEEGADIVMVKPALAYLDVIHAVRERFDVPVAAYNVSGEYAMVKAAATQSWLDEKTVALEILTAIHRAGADIIFTYWAREATGWLRTEPRPRPPDKS
ncbi:MAG: porphobilinogen synthase [Verrucomicrobiae bacterium]|nr:porphobilinogen synthase [Verrucomicrobiae bacterium]